MQIEKTMIEKARYYLRATEAERDAMRHELDACRAGWPGLIKKIRPQLPAKAETGWIRKRPFRLPHLAQQWD